MWKLSLRGDEVREWSELGNFQSISDATRQVLKLENHANGALFSVSTLIRSAQNRMRTFYAVSNTKARTHFIC
jgi:hypothetical protein